MERLFEVVGSQDFVEGTYGTLHRLLQDHVVLLKTQQHALAERLGEVSARSGKLADEWVNATSAVREVLGQRLNAASEELRRHEEGLRAARAQLRNIESRQCDIEWVTRALANFSSVWQVMSPANRGRLMRALIDRIVVKKTKVDIHLAHLDEEPVPEQTEAEP